jgi:hypothetical protein
MIKLSEFNNQYSHKPLARRIVESLLHNGNSLFTLYQVDLAQSSYGMKVFKQLVNEGVISLHYKDNRPHYRLNITGVNNGL